jgi:hypothetical protein
MRVKGTLLCEYSSPIVVEIYKLLHVWHQVGSDLEVSAIGMMVGFDED